MGMRYVITKEIAEFCAERELPQDEAVRLIEDLFAIIAGQHIDADVAADVKKIYASVIGYEIKIK